MARRNIGDPLFVIEREIADSPHLSQAIKRHVHYFATRLKHGLPNDIRHQAVARTAVSIYAELARMDEEAHGSPGLNGTSSAHWGTYIRLTSQLLKVTRALGFSAPGAKRVGNGEKGLMFTPPRPPKAAAEAAASIPPAT